MPNSDVALCVRMHGGVAGVPEEPDVLLVCDRFGVEEVMIDFRIWTKVEEVSGDGMETWWYWVDHGDCIDTKNRRLDYLYMRLCIARRKLHSGIRRRSSNYLPADHAFNGMSHSRH